MAKKTIAGSAFALKSTLKADDIALVEKFQKDALTLKGGEDGKEPIFAIGMGEAPGNINKYGVTFAKGTDEFAVATVMVPDGEDKEWVADNYGEAIRNLEKLEASLPDVVNTIKAEKAALLDAIETA